jgi:hypothetical protein
VAAPIPVAGTRHHPRPGELNAPLPAFDPDSCARGTWPYERLPLLVPRQAGFPFWLRAAGYSVGPGARLARRA